jgi:hypothetical protein
MTTNYITCQHYLIHKAERHECDGCCASYVLIDEKINTLNNVYYNEGAEDERKRILDVLCNKGMELEKDVSWDDEASHIRYVFMCDIIRLVREIK